MWHVQESTYLACMGRKRECTSSMEAGLVLARESGIHMLDFLLTAQGTYGCLFTGDLDGADVFLEQMPQRLHPRAHLDSAHFHHQLTWVALCRGDIVAARTHITTADRYAALSGAPLARNWVEHTLGFIHAIDGDTEAALRYLENALAYATSYHNDVVSFHCLLTRAYLLLKIDSPDAAHSALTQALTLGKSRGYVVHPWIGWRTDIMTRLYAVALDRGIEVEYCRNVIMKRRLYPPPNTVVPDTWPRPLKLHTLGRFTVLVDDKPLANASGHKKPLDVLQALISLGGRDVNEDKLAEMLWPETEGDFAQQNLKVNVHRLRKLLPEGAIVWAERKLSLDSRQAWVDLWALERELGCLNQSPPLAAAEQAALVSRVFRLYRGEFLDENTAPWALSARERLRGKTLQVVARIAEALGKHDPAVAVPVYEKAIELDPLREPLYQGLMRCQLQLHQPTEALQTYHRCRDTLKRELNLAPSSATEILYQVLKSPE
jgi:DNA-binding SARP family transcriptional activator